MADAALEPFYGAAARSMSESWHDFIFGAFDPPGPSPSTSCPARCGCRPCRCGSSAFNTWALVLPQVVEGMLTVLVLYRAVRRLAGPVAGLTAAAVLAASADHRAAQPRATSRTPC